MTRRRYFWYDKHDNIKLCKDNCVCHQRRLYNSDVTSDQWVWPCLVLHPWFCSWECRFCFPEMKETRTYVICYYVLEDFKWLIICAVFCIMRTEWNIKYVKNVISVLVVIFDTQIVNNEFSVGYRVRAHRVWIPLIRYPNICT